jgi:hypothetical protein
LSVEAALIVLHTRSSEAWARDARSLIRRHMAAAADVQGQLVDRMLAT